MQNHTSQLCCTVLQGKQDWKVFQFHKLYNYWQILENCSETVPGIGLKIVPETVLKLTPKIVSEIFYGIVHGIVHEIFHKFFHKTDFEGNKLRSDTDKVHT